MSPALVGRFLTTGPPGKSLLKKKKKSSAFYSFAFAPGFFKLVSYFIKETFVINKVSVIPVSEILLGLFLLCVFYAGSCS